MSTLIECKRCGKKYGSWSFRKVKNRRVLNCKACEAEVKAASLRKKQEKDVANHLQTQEVIQRVSHSWEERATARITD